MRPGALLMAAGFAASVGALVFACGSTEDGPGADAGPSADVSVEGSLADTSEASTSDGPPSDARPDAPEETGSDAREAGPDAGACALREAGATGNSGKSQWGSNFGITGRTYATSVAIHAASGDVVVAGYFLGTIDFGSGTATSHAPASAAESADAFVARFTSSGTFKWAKTFGNGFGVSANSVAVSASGHVVLAGNLPGGSLDFGCGALTTIGNNDVFVADLDATGSCVWSKNFGTAGQNEGINTVAVDGGGNVLLAGAGTALNLGGGPLTGYYLAKLNSSGAHSWSKGFAASTSYGGPWLTVDGQDNPVLAGSFTSTIDLGGGPLRTGGADAGDTTNAAFVAKFDLSGNYQWARQYGEGMAARNASINGVATDACGAIFVNGPFGGMVNFGSGALTSPDSTKSYAFLAKIDASGNGVWSKSFVGSNRNFSVNSYFLLGAIAVDAAGGPTIAANMVGDNSSGDQETVDFGGGPLTNAGRKSAAIASFDANGLHRWSNVGGAPSTATQSTPAYQGSVAAHSTGVVMTGAFGRCTGSCVVSSPSTTLVMGGRTLTAMSGQDLFISSFAP